MEGEHTVAETAEAVVVVNALGVGDLEEEEELEEDILLTSEDDPVVTDHQQQQQQQQQQQAVVEPTEEEDDEDLVVQPVSTSVPENDTDVEPSLPVIEVVFEKRRYELIYPSSDAFKTFHHYTEPATQGGLLFGHNESLLEEPLSTLFDHLRAELVGMTPSLGDHDDHDGDYDKAAAQSELKMVFRGLENLTVCEHDVAASSSISLAKLVQLYVVVTGMQGQEMLLEPFRIELTAQETFSAQLNRIQSQLATRSQQKEQEQEQQQQQQQQGVSEEQQQGSAVDNDELSNLLESDIRMNQADMDELLTDEQVLGMTEGEDDYLVQSDQQANEALDEDEFGLLDDESGLEINALDSALDLDSSTGRFSKRTVDELIDMAEEDMDGLDSDLESFKRRKKDD
ncbi:hypothetical protein BGX31_010742 [Mortierella sp. GBA43]|nr:hypothetical protein BGX31_010742 [Mortierella sp. GBA43]